MAAYGSHGPLWQRFDLPKMLHSPRLRWRTAFSYAVVIGLILFGLALYLARALDAPFGQVAVPVAVAGLLIIGLMVFQAERAAATVRRLTGVVEQIAGGDLDARIRSLSSGEIGQLARAFNRMADKLQKEMEKRARQKDRLNTVLHALTDGVLIVNRHGDVRLLNAAAERLLHTKAEHALDRTVTQAVRDHRIVEVYSRCVQSGQEEVAMLELEAGRVLRVVATPYLKGRQRGHVLILQDLTRLRQLQTVRQDFISNISHELRTPLASLRALVDTLRDGAMDDPPAAQHFLDLIDTEVDAMSQMVQELLELARIESGRVPIRLAPMPVGEAILPGVERLRPQAERAGLALKIDIPQDLPAVLVDAERVQQVMTNLVHNAVKFTSPGGEICVAARKLGADERHGLSLDEAALPDALGNAQAADDWVLVSVQDTGVGIAPDVLPRIFERFFKADQSRSGGGTGLGLAIAKHIVQAHGGQIWAESIEGQGSAFYFTLLAAPRDERELA